MPRPKRCEFQGAIYLVTLTGDSSGNVFYDPRVLKQHPDTARNHAEDAQRFEGLLWETCEQYDARVHAYALEPNIGLVLLQTLGGPLGWIMHDLLARYSTYLREQGRPAGAGRPFPGRYKAQIVQLAKLPYVVRYVHRRELVGDRQRRAINHPFSSNLIYCRRRPQPTCFVASVTRRALELLGHIGPNSYFEFMAARDTPAIAHLLSQRIIGDQNFGDFVRRTGHKMSGAPSPDEILREVTGVLLHAQPDIAGSSTHRGALARALVAWYAMRTGTARIGAVARWFGVTSSDLRYLIRRHRQRQPQYFSRPPTEIFPTLSRSEDKTSLPRSTGLQHFETPATPPPNASIRR